MDFEYLCNQYELGRFQGVTPLNPGTVSQVWRMETDRGVFLVRTLAHREQGEREYRVHRHLTQNGFDGVPVIVLTAELEGTWYQVQEYLGGTMPNPAQPGVAAAMAGLAKRLAAALSDYPGGSVIHGDLGPWNMLLGGDGRLMIIDFGETRTGDPYFDFAALLGGIINHSPAELRESVCREFVQTLDCDRGRLLEQLRLWAEQGIDRWTDRSEKMVSRFHFALNWAEEHLYDL